MEHYPTFGTEDDALSFWASHPEDLSELLATLPPLLDVPAPPAKPTSHPRGPVEGVQVAGEGFGSNDFAFCGDVALVEPVAQAGGGSPVGLSGTVVAGGGTPVGLSGTVLAPAAAEVSILAPDFWTPYSGPDCTGCCVVRDIIHTNDRFSMKLSIHGNLGFVDHALLVIHHFINEIVEEKFVADLSSMDAASMNKLFVDYAYCCHRLAQVLVTDTHQTFYDVLSVNIDGTDEEALLAAAAGLKTQHEGVGLVPPLPTLPSYPDPITPAGDGAETNHNILKAVIAALLWAVPELQLLLPLPGAVIEVSSFPPHLLLDLDEDMHLQRAWGLRNTRRLEGLGLCEAMGTGVHKVLMRKTGIAGQRERTGLLTFGDIARVFHLPITHAASELQICTTALKKVCRRYNVYRWPHRKVSPSIIHCHPLVRHEKVWFFYGLALSTTLLPTLTVTDFVHAMTPYVEYQHSVSDGMQMEASYGVLSSAKRIDNLRDGLKCLKGLESARTLCLLYAERRELRVLYRVRV